MRFLNRCWCLLLGMLLPSSCSDSGVDPTPEYGVPQATVILDGTVVDNLGAPVKGIVIEMDHFGSTVSDSLGSWSMEDIGFDACVADTQVACGLVATDVDGSENGGPYPPTLVALDLEQTKPGNGFDMGTYEQHDITIVMEDVIVEYGPQCAKAARDRKKNDDEEQPRRENS